MKDEHFATMKLNLIKEPSKPNIFVRWGDQDPAFLFEFGAKRNLLNRFKFWLLCKILPFKVVEWK